MSTAMMAQTDITPSAYKWNETGELPPISSVAVKGSNPAAPAFTTWNGETEYKNGLIGIDGANNNNFNPESVKAGMSIIDLGGEVGKVLAIRGAACENVESALKAATGNDITVAKMTAATTWFDLNFFSDPNNTPTNASKEDALPDDYIHVKMVLNVYTDDQTSTQEDESEPANITGIIASGNQNNLKPAGGVQGGKIYAYNFFETETEGEYAGQPAYDESNNAKWDPTRWMVVEFDTWCPEPDGDKVFTPFRVKMSCNSWANFSTETLFIKEISFTHCTGTPTLNCYSTVSKTYETLSVGGESGIKGIQDATAVKSAAKYNVAGQRVNDSYKGIVIQKGSKTIVR